MKACLDAILSALLAAGLGACGHDHDHGDDHDHAGQDHEADHGHDHGEEPAHDHGEEVAIGITRWTDRLELFAEHPPAVVGQELPFHAHFTILDGFRPLQEGSVRVELSGPATVSATAERALRPGIFTPAVTPPTAGTYQGRFVVSGPEVEDVVSGFEIEVHPDAATAARENPAGEEGSSITFLKEQQWQVPFATAFAGEGELVSSVEVGGEVETPPGGQAEVGAVIAGRVMPPPAGLPRPGQAVAAGELLATIAPTPSSPEESARARLVVVEAEARLQAAQAELARAQRLFADRAVPEREVADAQREVAVAEESLQAARRAAALFSGAASGRGAGSWRLTSPIAGTLVEVHATPGASVTAGELLFRVVDTTELWIRARVPEQDASRIRADQDAAYRIAGTDEWLPIEVAADGGGAVVTVGRVVNERSRTVDVLYALRAADPRLRIGALVRVSVPTGDVFRGVVVPESALVSSEGRDVLYVQDTGESFGERTVRIAARAGGRAAVERGVSPGERIVTEGATLVRLASRAGSAPAHGHVH